jgi:predicted pyridoxine 5'-phosphate oxidase superfamily flavin-nucleotide-binding protein
MPNTPTADPFHPGERILQERFGSRTRLAGSRAIRAELPPAFADFLSQLDLVIVGSIDSSGLPWTTEILEHSGFMRALSPTRLEIITALPNGSHLLAQLAAGTPIALLAIDFASRSRIRINGQIFSLERGAFVVEIRQAYGNCPQYITPRQMDRRAAPIENYHEVSVTDTTVCRLIEQADTFFIASYVRHEDGSIEMDVSHRGGPPGFVQCVDGYLTWPEYRGNFYFNTVGNLIQNPTCGLLIPDFTSGERLLLTGQAALEEFDGEVRLTPEGIPRLGTIRYRPKTAFYSPPAVR